MRETQKDKETQRSKQMDLCLYLSDRRKRQPPGWGGQGLGVGARGWGWQALVQRSAASIALLWAGVQGRGDASQCLPSAGDGWQGGPRHLYLSGVMSYKRCGGRESLLGVVGL